MNPLAETRIGPYRVLEQVGHGSMADVYRALHDESGLIVALKVPHSGDGFWEAERAGALIQRALHQMDARVPRVDEVRDEPGVRYIAMEFVDGEDLSRKLERGRLPWPEAIAIGRQLLAVLTAARLCPADAVRRGGIVHGDIKPSNVRVMASGEVRLLDFGIAKTLLESGQGTINRFQSLAYCSPERLADTKVNVHADLWAVAVVIYEMIAGARPFRADSPEDLFEQIRFGRARAATLDRGVPSRLTAVIEMALDPVLDRRYQSAEEFANDLAAAEEDRATLAERRLDVRRLEEATRRTEPPATNGAAAHAPGDTNGVATARTPGELHGANGVATTRTAGDPGGVNGADTVRPSSDRLHDPEATRRIEPNGVPTHGSASTGRLGALAAPAVIPQAPADRLAPVAAARGLARARSPIQAILVLILVALLANELWALTSVRELQSQLPSLSRIDTEAVWVRYQRLEKRSLLIRLAAPLVAGGIRDWMVSHADDEIGRFKIDSGSVRENGWLKARIMLEHAATFSPTDRTILARIDYCNGQIKRINAAASQDRARAQALNGDALTHFQSAARRWPSWTDPELGQAAVYAYGRREPENAVAALRRASEIGYDIGTREFALLGDAYRLRAETLWTRPTAAWPAERRHEHLERIRADYTRALDYYKRAPDFGRVTDHVASVEARLGTLDRRIERLIHDSYESAQ